MSKELYEDDSIIMANVAMEMVDCQFFLSSIECFSLYRLTPVITPQAFLFLKKCLLGKRSTSQPILPRQWRT